MKLLHRLVPLFLSVLLFGCAQNPAKSSNILAPAGAGFTVTMPGTPREGTSSSGMHVFSTVVDNIVYIASYANLKNEHLTQAQLDGALDSMARSEARNTGKLRSMKRISMDGHDGRDLIMISKDGMFVHERLTLVHGRRFRVGVASRVRHGDTPETTRFLDSFHITMH